MKYVYKYIWIKFLKYSSSIYSIKNGINFLFIPYLSQKSNKLSIFLILYELSDISLQTCLKYKIYSSLELGNSFSLLKFINEYLVLTLNDVLYMIMFLSGISSVLFVLYLFKIEFRFPTLIYSVVINLDNSAFWRNGSWTRNFVTCSFILFLLLLLSYIIL